jgi:galactokinase/mevalonate kinase-like predicted kinase
VDFQSVLIMAPLRISFLGGGSDISSFYEKAPGCVVSAAIDKYVYVHIKRHDPLFQERYRISYSEIVVPTEDSIRMKYLMKTLMSNDSHVLMPGPTGTGKSVYVQ